MPLEFIHWIADALMVLVLLPLIRLQITVGEMRTDIKWIMRGLKLSGDKAGYDLHSPHSPEFDKEIEAFWHGTLDDNGALSLASKLEMIIHENANRPLEINHPYTESQKQAAVRMLEAITTLYKIQPTGVEKTLEIKPKKTCPT